MKFRLQCAGCGATFFAPDRKARHCPKCVKKGASKTAAGIRRRDGKSLLKRIGARLERAVNREPEPPETPTSRTSKITVLTPELQEHVIHLYQTKFAGGEASFDEIIAQISDRTWVARKAVRGAINKTLGLHTTVTPELKDRIIEMYKGYVERSERPARGRRRTIAESVGVPINQVIKIVYDWSVSQYNQSPSPDLSRQQLFEIEKAYWDEMDRKRHRYGELPEKIAERLGYASAYQIRRLLDMLHDDWGRFGKITDPPPEAERQILEAYKQYLAAPQPPEKGLHSTIASQIGGVSARQVHKVLQRYRYRRRDEYPLK